MIVLEEFRMRKLTEMFQCLHLQDDLDREKKKDWVALWGFIAYQHL